MKTAPSRSQTRAGVAGGIARTGVPRRRILTLAASGAAASLLRPEGRAAAQTAEPAREVLPNGLTVIVEERPTAAVVAFNLTTLVGSREDGDTSGITLLTLRAMLAGTSRRPSNSELVRTAALVGGTVGGSADTESSVFSSLVPSREADTAFDLLADIVTDPVMDEQAVGRLKQVALQDVARRRADPSGLIAELFAQEAFTGHPVRTPVGGTPEGLEPLTRAGMVAHYQRYWGAANSVLAIVGRIRAQEAIDKARQYFGGMPAGSKNQRPAAAVRPRSGDPARGQAGQAQLQFRLAYPAPNVLDADRWAMLVLNAVSSNRMFREIRTDRGLAYSAGSGYQAFTDAGAWFASAGIDPENLDMVLDLVREEVRKLKEEPVDAEELSGRIGAFAGGQLLADESNAGRAGRISTRAIIGIPETEEFVRRVRAVTAADVRRVAQTYFDPARALLVVVSPRMM